MNEYEYLACKCWIDQTFYCKTKWVCMYGSPVGHS